MPNYKAILTGSWSNLSIWQDDSSGSYTPSISLPSSADTVYSNNFIITIDIDFIVTKITNKSSTNVLAGGGFIINTNRTITCLDTIWGIEGSNTTNATVITIQSATTININSNIIAGTTTNTYGVYSNVQTTLNIVGNVSGGQFTSNSSGSHGVFMDTSSVNSIINITGNVYAKGTTNTYQVVNNGVWIRSSSTTLNITGNLYGTTVTPQGIYSDIQYSTYMSGSNSILNVTGNVYANLNGAIYSLSGIVNLVGNAYSSSSSYAIISQNITISGNIFNSNGFSAIQSSRISFNQLSSPQWTFQTEIGGTDKILYPAGTNIGNPLPSNVRSGVAFGPNSEFTGTCVIPSATTVSLGVPVDNTVGSAINNMETIFNIPTSQVTGETMGTKILQIAPRKIGVSLIQNVGGVVLTTPFSYLLDEYPNAVAAYSLRKISSGYTGNAIRVRRSSDNTELDIGFSGYNLDITALSTFCSGTDGYVTTWYDQSGNDKHVSQGTAANQPQIVVNGTILTDNGKPSMNFDGSNDIFIRNENISSNIYMSTFTVGKLNSLTARLPFWDLSRIGNGNYMFETNTYSTVGQRFGLYTSTSFDSSKSTTLTPILSSIIANTSIGGNVIQNTGYFINGINETLTLKYGTGTYPSYVSGTAYSIGGSTYGVLAGRIQEFVYYQLNQSSNRIGIEGNINSYYNIY